MHWQVLNLAIVSASTLMYVTTPTNIWAWQQAIMISLELHSCCNANIERRSLIILAVFLSLATYSAVT